MALQALIQNPPRVTSPTQVNLFVQYYDDTEQANAKGATLFVAQVDMPFLSTATGLEIKDAVVAHGQALAAALTRLSTVKETIPTPTTIAIP